MAYANSETVSYLCQNIMGSEIEFSDTTNPTLTAVNYWLSSGCAFIETTLQSWKYIVPPASNTAVYGMLTELNAWYGAALVEMSRSNVTLALGERTRGQVFFGLFTDGLERLHKLDLTMAGATRSAAGGRLFFGAANQASKDNMTSDVVARVRRDMTRFPGVQSMGQGTSSSAGGVLNVY